MLATQISRLQIELLVVDNEKLDRVIELLDTILTRVTRLETYTFRLALQGEKLMATQADVQAKLDALHDDVESETSVVDSVETLLTGQTEMLQDLKKQLQDAVDAADPAALAMTIVALDQITTTQTANRKRVIAAVLANTPSGAGSDGSTQPPPPPTQPPPPPRPDGSPNPTRK